MLKKSLPVLMALVVSIMGCCVATVLDAPPAYADSTCPTGAKAGVGGYDVIDVEAAECQRNPGGESGSGSGGESRCFDSNGQEVPCEQHGFVWTPSQQEWCVYDDEPHPSWIPPVKGAGRWLICMDSTGNLGSAWDLLPYVGPDPETLLRSALDSVQLKPAKFHIGAWTDSKYPAYGIIWWVGAPLWLWLDMDPHMWGTHSLEASAGNTSITATVKSTSIVYTMGDGETVTCHDFGKVRRNSPYEPMANESTCQHKYMHTNTLKDPTSRYTITAEVIWTIWWETNDGHTGKFTHTIPAENTEQVHIGELRVFRR